MNSGRDKAAGILGKAGGLMLGFGIAFPLYGTAGVTWQNASPAVALGIGAIVLAVCLILSAKPRP